MPIPEFNDDALIADGDRAGNYDRPYSLNPIPINPRTPEPSNCTKEAKKPENTKKFEKEIQAYLAQDKVTPPKKHEILFIGSSIFVNWKTLSDQMSPLPVINRSFGGATTDQIIFRTNQIVIPYQPKIIVYYCGSNDISLHKKPNEILKNFTTFSETISKELPDTTIVFLSINKAPSKKELWDEIDETNEKVEQYCHNTKRRIYIDINPLFFDNQGDINYTFFYSDNLHLRQAAYDDLSKVIRPLLESMWKKNQTNGSKN